MSQTPYRSALMPRISAVLMVLLVGAAGATAQNLLQNADFAFDSGHWTTPDTTVEIEPS
ncbi:MAG: hypothetical protein KAJ78_08345 [Acidobacteria bacterium]|nr:hypothetical protein [Acidobacteriota bacterium]